MSQYQILHPKTIKSLGSIENVEDDLPFLKIENIEEYTHFLIIHTSYNLFNIRTNHRFQKANKFENKNTRICFLQEHKNSISSCTICFDFYLVKALRRVFLRK